jgi:23S rRNA (uridine2552-2'-O)-methyltransferase
MARQGQEDALYHRAKREGWAARSVYKLQELDRRHRLLRRGQRVLDLGCHPGSWLQYAAGRVGPAGLVVGVDLKPPAVELPPNARFVRADLAELEPATLEGLAPAFDLVLSDAAPPTTGVKAADQAKSAGLVEAVLALAGRMLAPGGDMVAKMYQGGETDALLRQVRRMFKKGKAFRPQATTGGSKEIFLVGLGRKGPPSRGDG